MTLSIGAEEESTESSITWQLDGHDASTDLFVGSAFLHDVNLNGTPEFVFVRWDNANAEVRVFGRTKTRQWEEVVGFAIVRTSRYRLGGLWTSGEAVSAGGGLLGEPGTGCWSWTSESNVFEPGFAHGDCVVGDRSDVLGTTPLALIVVLPSAAAD